jgi:hypothetical protein
MELKSMTERNKPNLQFLEEQETLKTQDSRKSGRAEEMLNKNWNSHSNYKNKDQHSKQSNPNRSYQITINIA